MKHLHISINLNNFLNVIFLEKKSRFYWYILPIGEKRKKKKKKKEKKRKKKKEKKKEKRKKRKKSYQKAAIILFEEVRLGYLI